MAVQLPTPQQIRELADEMGLDLTDADVESYRGLFQENVDAVSYTHLTLPTILRV